MTSRYRSLEEVTAEYFQQHPEEIVLFLEEAFAEYALDGNSEGTIPLTPELLMAITLTLSNHSQKQLQEEAASRGMSAVAYAEQILETHLRQQAQNQEAIALIQSWMDEEDSEEQKETGTYLVEALDKSRLSERKLFPAEREGITW